MRLRPRASSSDLDEARAIARRLERTTRGGGAPPASDESYVRFASAPSAAPQADDTLPPGTASPEPEPAVVDTPAEPEPTPPEAAAPATAAAPESEPTDSVAAIVTFPPGEPSEGPTWDTLLLTAQALADAHAAMVVAADGSLIAASGDWPEVGAQAVAAKLLPLVGKKLEAGGQVPVKMAGQVLTAWRLEVAGRPVTVALLAAQAIGAELRPEVDQQLVQGPLD